MEVDVRGDSEDGLEKLDAVTDFRRNEVWEFVVAALGGADECGDGALDGGGGVEWV